MYVSRLTITKKQLFKSFFKNPEVVKMSGKGGAHPYPGGKKARAGIYLLWPL